MRTKLFLLIIIGLTFLSISGCMTYEKFVEIDEQVKKITALQAQAQDKLAQAKNGDLTVTEALAWVRQTNEQIIEAKNQIDKIKESKDVGWTEVIGAAIASIIGATGWVRAWRGPSHKGATITT